MRTRELLFALCVLAGVALLAAASQSPSQAAAPSPASFVGERLVYKVEWDPPWFLFFLPKMDAGEAVLELQEAEYRGEQALQVRFTAMSSGTLVSLAKMKIEDEFVYLTRPGTFCTLHASEKIREGKRKRQVDVEYFGDRRQLHVREVDEAPVPPIVRKDETKNDIPECVHDPFSALYLFRQSPLAPGYSRSMMMANVDKIREIRAVVEKKETVRTRSGEVSAWKVGIAALMGGLFKEGGQFRMWLTADERKLPVQFEVKVRLGHVLGRLQN